jgi:hypothetical protein
VPTEPYLVAHGVNLTASRTTVVSAMARHLRAREVALSELHVVPTP